MNKDELSLWKPNKRIPHMILFLECWIWNEDGVKIVLSSEKEKYSFFYKNHVVSFRSTTEKMMLKFRDLYGELRKNKKFKHSWSLFKVNNSSYVEWINNQHYSIYSDIQKTIEHYVFVTEDEIIEILNDIPPKIHIEVL